MPRENYDAITEDVAKKFIRVALKYMKGKDSNDFDKGVTSLLEKMSQKFPKSFQNRTRCYSILRHISDRPEEYDESGRKKMLSEMERIKKRKATLKSTRIDELEKRIEALEKLLEDLMEEEEE